MFSGLHSINRFVIFLIISSCVVGGLGGLNQRQLRKMMAYSSINHMSWTISAMIRSRWLWLKYYAVYCFISIYLIFQFIKANLFSVDSLTRVTGDRGVISISIRLLRLGGLPPFLGFVPKWRVIYILRAAGGGALGVFLATFTLISLYFYVRLTWGFMGITGTKLVNPRVRISST